MSAGLVFRCAAAAVLCASICLLIKRSNPELAFSLGTITAAMLLILSLGALSQSAAQSLDSLRLPQNAQSCLKPVIRCLGVALTTRYSASLCRDASQSSLALAVETAGTVCAALLALPSLAAVLKLMGELL